MRQWHMIHLVRLTAGLAALALHSCSNEVAKGVTLGWDPSTESGIAGYRLYYGVASRSYTNMINVGNRTNFQVTGLSGDVNYFFAVSAYNTLMIESPFSSEVSFNPSSIAAAPTNPPIAGTIGASELSDGVATLKGLVNPEGSATTSWFDWGTTKNFGARTALRAVGNGSNTVSVADALFSLRPATAYYFRLVATNGCGSAIGSTATFKTLPALPMVAIQPASSVTSKAATLNGTVNPNGAATTAWFEYGMTSSYGAVTARKSLAGRTSSSPLSTSISGLAAGMLYHYRLIASNAVGRVTSADATFVTAVSQLVQK